MKKVLLLVTKSNWGGAQRYVYDLATHLPKTDFQPVVGAGPSQGSQASGPLLEKLTQAGVRTLFVPELQRDMGGSEWVAYLALLKILRTERPDVLHLNSSKAGLLGALAGRIAHLPRIVFTVHGWPFLEKRSFVWRAIAWTGSMLTLALAHRVICVSYSDRDSVPSWARRKVVAIHNAVPTDTLALDKSAAREKLIALGVPREKLDQQWIGMVAEHTSTKDIPTALRAFAHSIERDTAAQRLLILIGDGEDHASLRLLAKSLGIAESVFFTGFVSQAGQLMPAFDATLLTSQKEGLPYAILESLSARVPVIASAVGGIPELVTSHKNGLLCPVGDTECFANALREVSLIPPLITNPESFEEMISSTADHY